MCVYVKLCEGCWFYHPKLSIFLRALFLSAFQDKRIKSSKRKYVNKM